MCQPADLPKLIAEEEKRIAEALQAAFAEWLSANPSVLPSAEAAFLAFGAGWTRGVSYEFHRQMEE